MLIVKKKKKKKKEKSMLSVKKSTDFPTLSTIKTS